MATGIILVDHGSRLIESNELLVRVAEAFGRRFADRYPIVEPAHMEIAEPTIGQAYGRCVGRGADLIIVVPYFLGPGKHWTEDIPRLAAAAAGRFAGTRHHVSPCLGMDDRMLELIAKRVGECLENA
jgi:sirohydrochlorin ferrochelatase